MAFLWGGVPMVMYDDMSLGSKARALFFQETKAIGEMLIKRVSAFHPARSSKGSRLPILKYIEKLLQNNCLSS